MRLLSVYFKGMAMGAADVVPGVSGGTIAFITGILDPLLNGIRALRPSLFGIIKRDGIKAAFEHINGRFLCTVFAGILTSIFTFAKLISYLLTEHPILLWSFFFGLILYSVVHMLKQVSAYNFMRVCLFIAGVIFAWFVTVLNPVELEVSYLNFFIAGCIAICAMILPGISGSFILLLLGLYPAVLAAVKGFDIIMLASFAVGCAVGLLSFSHVLSALLRRFHDETVLFLTGLMLGTLGIIWPWKEVLTWRENSQGETVPLLSQNISPMQFEQIMGQPSHIVGALICLSIGIALVWCLEKFGRKNAIH